MEEEKPKTPAEIAAEIAKQKQNAPSPPGQPTGVGISPQDLLLMQHSLICQIQMMKELSRRIGLLLAPQQAPSPKTKEDTTKGG